MRELSEKYEENVRFFEETLRVKDNFDVIKKVLRIGSDEITLFYVDGLIKDGAMQKLFIYLLSLQGLPKTAEGFLRGHMPYVEADLSGDGDMMLQMVLSGATVLLGSTFGREGLIVDARTYPARETAEPENDRVMRGARDGFVETLIFNTALIRRRIRDVTLTMSYHTAGTSSKSDIVVAYMADRADPKLVQYITEKVDSLQADALTMGHESLAESLIKTHWYNPFPKIRYTERPDTTAAHLLEGSVVILLDNSPSVMILPTSIFTFLQETNDFYLPPLTGTYLRVVRHAVFWLTLFLTPLFFLGVVNPGLVPEWLAFAFPTERGKVPVYLQLLLAEFVIDGLRMASMNTPDMLANSLSVVGGLILGEFAVSAGWLIPEVILYMSFVAIANFTQTSFELGYALKFLRILLLTLTAFFNVWGFLAGVVLIVILIATNKTVNGGHSYLYPLIPFSGRALLSLFIRRKKRH
ncbi:MAG: spore germination protein [Ruminococcaceae bacterium]|nr:spore germination protein [Oscillospiraceae bacterium]